MSQMTLSEELKWRGFVNQTTFKDISAIDGEPITFYLGMDPSAKSLQIGNLAIAMMIRHFIDHGHKAVMLVGGATGLIGDPDGKAEERVLKSEEEVAANKAGIAKQYDRIFDGKPFIHVDNYDWFKGMGYLQFLREVGKHVPMSDMLSRQFVSTRLGEGGAGISYAEFSYALIQGYDFVHLHREFGVTLQLCGSDQWGNSMAGVELLRRMDGVTGHVWSGPLVINKATGRKFGKSEGGTIWLDPEMTSPTAFYQFWINSDDEGVEDYIKYYTLLDKPTVDDLMEKHRQNPGERLAQTRLAEEVTRLVHGDEAMQLAKSVTDFMVGRRAIGEANDEQMAIIRKELPSIKLTAGSSVLDALVTVGLATSKTDARRLLQGNAISVNNEKITDETLGEQLFQNGRLLIRKGRAFKDSALIEL